MSALNSPDFAAEQLHGAPQFLIFGAGRRFRVQALAEVHYVADLIRHSCPHTFINNLSPYRLKSGSTKPRIQGCSGLSRNTNVEECHALKDVASARNWEMRG